jgi:hypothetical protein
MRRRCLAFTLIGFFVVGLGLWRGKSQLLAWYYVHQLSRAHEGDRETWIKRVSDLDDGVVPCLIKHLSQDDDRACDNVAMAIQELVARWGLDDPRTLALSAKLADAFPGMSPGGQERVLKMGQGWINSWSENRRSTVRRFGAKRSLWPMLFF